MNLFKEWVHSWLPGSGGEAVKRRYIVDPAPRLADKDKKAKLTPAEQVKFLQRLARFARKETLEMSTVFATKELRAVQHRGDFQGITVFFESDLSEFERMVVGVIQEQAQDARVTVITDDQALDQVVRAAGADAMRMSTFAKALEGGSEPGNGTGSRPSRSNRRPRNRRRGKSDHDGSKISRQGGSDTTAVRDLIDLVD